MRRLSVARDRELRHLADQQIGWRPIGAGASRIAWCRVCRHNATQQTDWLADNGYTVIPGPEDTFRFANMQPTALVGRYLERYPR